MDTKYSVPNFLKVFLIAGVVLFFGLGVLLLVDPESGFVDRLGGLLTSLGALALLFALNVPLGSLEIGEQRLRQLGLVWGETDLSWDDVTVRQSDLGRTIPRLSDARRRHQILIYPLLPEFREIMEFVIQRRADLWRFPGQVNLLSTGWSFFALSALFLFAFGAAGMALLGKGNWIEIALPGLLAVLLLVQIFRIPLKIDVAPGSLTFYYLLGSRSVNAHKIRRISLEEEPRSMTARKRVQIEMQDGKVVNIGSDLHRNVLYVFEYLHAWHRHASLS